jgi:hypothetical protein
MIFLIVNQPITACKQYCLAAGATQGNIAYTQTVMGKFKKRYRHSRKQTREPTTFFDTS